MARCTGVNGLKLLAVPNDGALHLDPRKIVIPADVKALLFFIRAVTIDNAATIQFMFNWLNANDPVFTMTNTQFINAGLNAGLPKGIFAIGYFQIQTQFTDATVDGGAQLNAALPALVQFGVQDTSVIHTDPYDAFLDVEFKY